MPDKTLVIINEPFAEMALGKNGTLSQLLAAASRGDDVYIYNLDEAAFPNNPQAEIPTIKLNPQQVGALIANYQRINNEILRNELAQQQTREKFDQFLRSSPSEEEVKLFLETERKSWPAINNLPVANYEKTVDGEQKLITGLLDPASFERTNLRLADISINDQIIQRTEPMKAPFPPKGNESPANVLSQIRNMFPDHVFNCPIFTNESGQPEEFGDKQTPQDINNILGENVATPTAEFNLDSGDYYDAIHPMAAQYSQLFSTDQQKIIIKPKDSAQSLGVFAMEFSNDGMNLDDLKTKTLENLGKTQTYKIKSGLAPQELKEMVKTLCFVQNELTDTKAFDRKKTRTIGEFSAAEIETSAKNLYHGQVLAQPFLEGVKRGDIRANYVKNENGDFYLSGCTYRKSARGQDGNFTTCYTTGGAVSKPISELSPIEQEKLLAQSEKILSVLNGPLKGKYANSRELGADFILVGNKDQDVMLGEINHHCPALKPISEMLNKVIQAVTGFLSNIFGGKKGPAEYEGGLGISRRYIDDAKAEQIQKYQEKHSNRAPSPVTGKRGAHHLVSGMSAAEKEREKGKGRMEKEE